MLEKSEPADDDRPAPVRRSGRGGGTELNAGDSTGQSEVWAHQGLGAPGEAARSLVGFVGSGGSSAVTDGRWDAR